MYEIRTALIGEVETLIQGFEKLIEDYRKTENEKQKNMLLFKVNFIKNLLQDVQFLIEEDQQGKLSNRNADLIIRNMLEQLIEFLYVLKHPGCVEEYFGEKIKLPLPDDADNLARILGAYRFEEKRKKICEMAKEVGQYKNDDGDITLYDMYKMFSETSHNSYFISWVETCKHVENGKKDEPLSSVQIRCLQIIVGCVLIENFDIL